MRALQGVRVVDLGRFIAGPYAATLLADFGADVVRVEPPGGGDDRNIGPVSSAGEGALFFQVGRNKRSLTLDHTHPEGRAVLERLIGSADVVITNVAPGQLERLRLSYDALKAIKPDIVVANASAFGAVGPWSNRPGFDSVGQAMSGSIMLSGEPGRPSRAQVNWVDYSTALHMALGVMIALFVRAQTGEGQEVGASLLETAISYQNPMLIDQLVLQSNRHGLGSRAFNNGPTDVFRVRDGWIVCHVVGDNIFGRWARLMGDEEAWTGDPRFASDALRGANGAVLSQAMQAWCEPLTREEALHKLAEAKVPAAPVLSPAEVLLHPQVAAVEAMRPAGLTADGEEVQVALAPIAMGETPAQLAFAAPRPGAHSAAVLAEIGYSSDEIERFRANGVI